MKEIDVNGVAVPVLESASGTLYYPESWAEEVETYGFDQLGDQILAKMPSCALNTPWILGSASKSIDGGDRIDSPSHLNHKAFDMSPMYSENIALAPDRQLMGMAWNVNSLILMAQAQDGQIPFVVEADHLHVQPGGDPTVLKPGQLFVCMSQPGWYPVVAELQTDRILSALNGSIWKFDLSYMKMELPQEVRDELLRYLGPSR